MSNQLPGANDDQTKQVKVRAPARLVEQYDDWVDESDQYGSRSEAIRAAMKGQVSPGESNAPRQPPQDNENLRDGYLTLVEIANSDGVIPHNLAVNELQTTLGKSSAVIEHAILGKLWDRGYLFSKTNFDTTNRSWKLTGWSE